MRTFPNPPTAQEINAARELVSKSAGMPDGKPMPEVMNWWKGEGWHKTEIYFGILIGLQIAKARRDKEEA